MHAVDTNVLVRLFAGDDPEQAARAKHFIGSGAWISHLVLAETVWVLRSVYSLDRDKLIRAVEMMLSNKYLTLEDRDVVADALSLFRDHKGVNFSDCLILSTAKKLGHGPVGTFDAKFGRLDNAALI